MVAEDSFILKVVSLEEAGAGNTGTTVDGGCASRIYGLV